MAERRRRTGLEPLLNLLIFLVVAALVGLVGIIIYARVNEALPDEPMISPGTFKDAQGQFKFDLGAGWEVKYEGQNTVIYPKDNPTLPSFHIGLRTSEELILVANLNCDNLPISRVAEVLKPAEQTSVLTSMPCTQNPAEPFYGKLYYSFMDGTDRLAVYIFGPFNRGRWVVAYTDPFEGEWPPELVDTMTKAIVTSR